MVSYRLDQLYWKQEDAYIKLKGVGKDKTLIRGTSRNINVFIKHLGDRPIDSYSLSDAAALRDVMLDRGLYIESVQRNFSTIRSIINLIISERRTLYPATNRFLRLDFNYSSKPMCDAVSMVKKILEWEHWLKFPTHAGIVRY